MVRHTSKILQQCIFSLCIKGLKLFFLSAIIEWNNSNHSLRNGPSVCGYKQNILKFIRYIKYNSCSTNLLEDPVWDWTMNVSIGLLTILVIASISSEFKNLISNLSTISSSNARNICPKGKPLLWKSVTCRFLFPMKMNILHVVFYSSIEITLMPLKTTYLMQKNKKTQKNNK